MKHKGIDTSKLNQIDAYTYPDHDRANNPPVGMARYDTAASPEAKYAYDPHIDPSLQWAGKAEGTSFEVPTSSIHVHEVIKPHKIIRAVQTLGDDYVDPQGSLFESDVERAKRRNDAIEFYQHKDKWTNRLIAGDSLVIMNSMLEKEGMAGQVQMVYIDPPYGIKYGSNFQPFVNKRDVKDRKDEDLSTEPEMIKAFRDTWELGIHSYLSYLRNRLLLARELLSENGSVFVQISDENVHHIRELCDEVFSKENFCRLITFQKTSGQETNVLASTVDFIIWYAKDLKKIKYRQLYQNRLKGDTSLDRYDMLMLSNGETRRLSTDEIKSGEIPSLSKRYQLAALYSEGSSSTEQNFEFKGKIYKPRDGTHWKTTVLGLAELSKANRIEVMGSVIRYRRYVNDFPVIPITDRWESMMLGTQRNYVVETAPKVISRCLLMTTDPDDLVLDITCGSGTTAYVAEQWGRRWITCDTSRIAITLAKKRLMTATFDFYKIKDEEETTNNTNKDSFVNIRTISERTEGTLRGKILNCPSNGFIYKTVPHITLKSIANNETPEKETLYDQPEIEKRKVRITGPFTVEALPAPVVIPLDDLDNPAPYFHENTAQKQFDWMQELKASGILGRKGEKIKFSRIEPIENKKFLHADAETEEDKGERKRAVINFAGETQPLDTRMVNQALYEAQHLIPQPSYVIFAAFQFDPAAAGVIDETDWKGVALLKVQMNPDLMTGDLKKKISTSQSFWLIGQPDVDLICIDKGKDKSKYKVKVKGFDYYDIKKAAVNSGNADQIAMWMLDTDYDGMCVEPKQVFFPMEGSNDGWGKLAKTLKAEIDQDLIEKYRGTESLPFEVKDNTLIAVKIVDDRGIESLKVLAVGTEG
jgi:adenine-specific DNA-methyltransferase